jgi:acetyl esterase/lipase
MKTPYLLLLFLLLATTCFAQETTPADETTAANRTPLWEGLAPVGEGATEEANAWITVHRPTKGNGTAIVICPGGGYGGLVVGAEGHGIAAWLNQHGITGVVLEYRLPAGRHAVPLLDAQRAIRTVRANAKDWELDPAKIGIMGFSAGGHLASTAATHFDDGEPNATDPIDRVSCRPDFAILVYPVVTLMGEKTHQGTKTNLLGKDPSPELVKLYSNELQVTAETPPMFLAHALDDGPVPPENSKALYAALQKQGIPSKYLELPSGGHGLNGYKGPMWNAWQEQSLAWLDELNKPKLAEPIVAGQHVFTCGHSFHVWVPAIVSDLCKSAGIENHTQIGVSSIGGSRVIQHWDIPDDKNTAKTALRTGTVDVLTLSPIFLPDVGIENFTSLALEHNSETRVIVQPIWLRWDIYEPTTVRPAKVDHNAITGEELRKRHAEHFQKMDEHIRALNKQYGKTVLYIAPAPQAVIALREKIIAGEAPGLKTQEDLFTDELGHGKPPLMALVGYVNYATIYRRSPIGLPVPAILKQANLGDNEEPLNRLLQELAWDVVMQHPLSGVQLNHMEKD